MAFAIYYAPKLSGALFLGSFVFITKRKYWTIVAHILFDIWILANLLYYRANEILIDFDAMMMASNMGGAESSILTYWKGVYFLIPVITILYSILTLFIKSDCRYWRGFWISLVLSVFTIEFSYFDTWNWCYKKEYEDETALIFLQKNDPEAYGRIGWKGLKFFIPYNSVTQVDGTMIETEWATGYVKRQAILQYLPSTIIHHIVLLSHNHELESYDASLIVLPESCISDSISTTPPNTKNLVIILVESLESWVFDNDEIAKRIAPNMFSLLRDEHTLWARYLESQALHGVSGDGQMLTNTGLLPIQNGAACMLYGAQNEWPNIAHMYGDGVVINPWPHIWNQDTLTYKYGYKRQIAQEGIDDFVFSTLTDEINKSNTTFCALAITVASHTPFNRVKHQTVSLPADMPTMMAKYLNCLHYTDSCFGCFYDQLSHEQKENTTIVITGDHTIFKTSYLEEFADYAEKMDLSIRKGKNYIPLIVHSPFVTHNIVVDEPCYQMDIYPTIMSVIGTEDYYWHGFGVNLMDSAALYNRQITEEEAYRLSDLIIRSNYFKITR